MHRNLLLNMLSRMAESRFLTPEEAPVLQRFREFVASEPACFDRAPNPCHVTGSAVVMNHEGSKVLLMHHRKVGKWLQLGGHADGDSDVKAVAMKEALEESGFSALSFVLEDPIDIDIHDLPNHMKCRTHFDVRFLLRAPQNENFVVNEESNALAWFDYDTALSLVEDKATKRLIEKAKQCSRVKV